jgi:hypothetical protein
MIIVREDSEVVIIDPDYPLVMTNSSRTGSHGPVEIVDFPSYKMVMFHSYVNVYQRVNPIKSHQIKPP